jgi:hypothetical protein
MGKRRSAFERAKTKRFGGNSTSAVMMYFNAPERSGKCEFHAIIIGGFNSSASELV